MYIPKKYKYITSQKHRKYKINKNYLLINLLLFGNIAAKTYNISYFTNKHLHRLIFFVKKLNKKKKYNFNRIWLPYFPIIPIFKKSRNARMGKGKGSKINWKIILYPFTSVIESKNIRIGRFTKYVNIIITRLPSKLIIINNKYNVFLLGYYIYFIFN